jgi:hypothetical protein
MTRTGRSEAEAEVGLSLGRQNLDHNPTNSHERNTTVAAAAGTETARMLMQDRTDDHRTSTCGRLTGAESRTHVFSQLIFHGLLERRVREKKRALNSTGALKKKGRDRQTTVKDIKSKQLSSTRHRLAVDPPAPRRCWTGEVSPSFIDIERSPFPRQRPVTRRRRCSEPTIFLPRQVSAATLPRRCP